jgi:hypothetical protein
MAFKRIKGCPACLDRYDAENNPAAYEARCQPRSDHTHSDAACPAAHLRHGGSSERHFPARSATTLRLGSPDY